MTYSENNRVIAIFSIRVPTRNCLGSSLCLSSKGPTDSCLGQGTVLSNFSVFLDLLMKQQKLEVFYI
jgi:hypothetical protein